jgi:CRISPR-associated exonuclease Cas4
MLISDFKSTGTQMNYFFVCKTQLWFFSHKIQMEQESDIVSLGKQLHEDSYKREKEFLIDNLINVDFIKKGKIIEIHEIKKSPQMEKAHEYQLLYYIYYLKNEKSIDNIIGYIDYPIIKKKVKLELSPEKEYEIEDILKKIKKIINSELPKPKKQKICRGCSYFELCWI